MFEGMFEIFNEEKKEDSPREEANFRPSGQQGNLFVLSIGGSVLMDGKPNSEAIALLAGCLNEVIRQGTKLVLVVGGGKVARDYVNAAKELGANNFELDELGIRITRANASLLIPAIENSFPMVLCDIKKAKEILSQGKTPVFGGLMPGFTTDAVAALLAEYLNATFVNLSNVDGIFTADPAVYENAKMYSEISYGKLLEILTSCSMKPCQNLIVDLPAAMILKRSNLTAFFLNGRNFENLKSALQGSPFKGTIVKPESGELLQGEEDEQSAAEETEIAMPKRRRVLKRKPVKKKKPSRRHEEDPRQIDPYDVKF